MDRVLAFLAQTRIPYTDTDGLHRCPVHRSPELDLGPSRPTGPLCKSAVSGSGLPVYLATKPAAGKWVQKGPPAQGLAPGVHNKAGSPGGY